jgi:hypothetical protein
VQKFGITFIHGFEGFLVIEHAEPGCGGRLHGRREGRRGREHRRRARPRTQARVTVRRTARS